MDEITLPLLSGNVNMGDGFGLSGRFIDVLNHGLAAYLEQYLARQSC